MIDEIDIEILNIIQNNGRIPNAELARQLKLDPALKVELEAQVRQVSA